VRVPCSTPIVAVRADVGRLPFATGSVDAIHAGAAMHCWPNPQAAMAEISRVLRPGGVFVASTFLNPFAPLGELVGDSIVRPLSQVRGCCCGALGVSGG
jgi:SAM-dependent methyltransferase